MSAWLPIELARAHILHSPGVLFHFFFFGRYGQGWEYIQRKSDTLVVYRGSMH